MKKLYLLSTILLMAFVFVYSCSTEEEDTTPPPSVVATPEPEPPAPTQYTLTVTAGEGGSVSAEGGTYDEGTEVTITATPDEGYEFVGWEGSDSESNSLAITLSGDTTLAASFRKERLSLIISIMEGPPDKVVTGFTFHSLFPFDQNNIFFQPTNFFSPPRYPFLHLKRDSIWKINRIYDDYKMEVLRDFKKINQNSFITVDTGFEIGQEDREQVVDLSLLDMGDVFHFKFEDDILTRTTLNSHKGFYHSVDAGDLDKDGKLDAVALYQALPVELDNFSNLMQGTGMSMFSESTSDDSKFVESTNKLQILDWESSFSGAVLIDEFTGDNQLDLIKFSYKTPPGFETREEFLYSYELLSYDEDSKKIESLHRKSRFEEYPLNYGIAWARSFDMDNDNDKDLIVFMERGSGVWKMQVWENTTGGNFEFSSEILSTEILGFQSRDFHVFDFDNDGDLDIFLQPFGSIEFPINFSSSIYVNNNGVFERYNEDIIYDDEYRNMYGLMFMVREDKPCYIGIEEMPAGQLKFYEFELNLD